MPFHHLHCQVRMLIESLGCDRFPHCFRRGDESVDEESCNMEVRTGHFAGPLRAASRELKCLRRALYASVDGVLQCVGHRAVHSLGTVATGRPILPSHNSDTPFHRRHTKEYLHI